MEFPCVTVTSFFSTFCSSNLWNSCVHYFTNYSIILYIYIHEWPSSGFVSCLYSYTKYYIKPKFVTASSSSCTCPSKGKYWKGRTPWTTTYIGDLPSLCTQQLAGKIETLPHRELPQSIAFTKACGDRLDSFSRILGRGEKQVCWLVCLDTCKVRKSEN